MERKLQKHYARKELRKKDRHDRFIAAYVRAKHSEVYMEAERFYNHLDERNPCKKDLCKTVEFLQCTTSFKSFNEYYKREKASSKTDGKNQSSKTNGKNQSLGMVLTIPLMPNKKPKEPPVNTFEPPPPLAIPVQTEVMNTSDEPPLAMSNQTEGVNTSDEPPLIYSNQMYEDLFEELRKDPDLQLIFNDMSIPQNENNEDSLCQDLWDVQQTPLESELFKLGY